MSEKASRPPQPPPEERLNDEVNRRVKRARLHWEREGEFERECLQNAFASQQQHLQRVLASQEELLATAAEEASRLRAELWRTRAALDDARAQLAARPVTEEDQGDDEEDLVQATIQHMQEQVQLCEDASPKPRRYYYPQGVGSLPRHLHALSTDGLAEAIARVKDWVKNRAIAKRVAKAADDDSSS